MADRAPLISGVDEERGGRREDVVIDEFKLFSFFAFLWVFNSILETEEEPCLDPHIA